MELSLITGLILEESIKIHTDLGPGLFESVYEEILYYRLDKWQLLVKKQIPIAVYYKK
ncbi:MAG TPA: GxxExxY protein [Puia sp.]|jgi:GxxExxY protein|nr:GxxExxY protein [Puia sp.]